MPLYQLVSLPFSSSLGELALLERYRHRRKAVPPQDRSKSASYAHRRDWVGRVVSLFPQTASAAPFHLNATTPHIPTCISLEEVANPQDLWDLVLAGEALPEDESPEEVEPKA